MKKTILVLMLSILAPAAFAAGGNDGPQAVPAPQKRLVAEVFSACGFFCPKGDTRSVQIFSDGKVEAVFEQRQERPKRTEIARLSTEAAARFVKIVEETQISVLKDEEPGSPECMDAPVTYYRVSKTDGSASEIRRLSGCHTFSMENGAGRDIVNILDGFNILSPFMH